MNIGKRLITFKIGQQAIESQEITFSKENPDASN